MNRCPTFHRPSLWGLSSSRIRARGGRRLLAAAASVFLLVAPAAAGDDLFETIRLSDRVELHGFGGLALGTSDGNDYQLGGSDHDRENFELTLNLVARPTESLAIVAQAGFDGNEQALDTVVDYAFIEWSFSDAGKLRLGRAKHPFGIYGEVFGVGTLRPFLMLPQGIYGSAGMVIEEYTGAALTGSYDVGDWELQYDVYGGNAHIHVERPWLALMGAAAVEEDHRRHIGDLAGARLLVGTPVNGLSFGLSGYFGTQEEAAGGRIPSGDHRVYGFQVEYQSAEWLVRSELARHEHLTAATIEGAYLELARALSEKWQLALRYDRGDVDVEGFAPIGRAPSLWEHEDLALGVSRWLSPNVVLRAEVHRVEGNRFAGPEDLAEAVAAGTLDNTTNVFQLGIQFGF